MNNVELKGITLLSLGLSVALLGGCAGTTEQLQQPGVQTAVARGGNTYVIKRASIRTPGAEVLQRAYVGAVRPSQARQSSSGGLTREQYQDRFEIEQRLQEERAERARIWEWENERRRLTAKKDAQRKELEAKRELYQAKWSQERKRKENAQAVLRAKANAEQARKELVQVDKRSGALNAPASQVGRRVSAPVVKSNAAPILLGQAVRRTSASARPSARVIRADVRTAALVDRKVESVIANAKKHLGSRYVWGGDSPDSGFDCSGLVQHSLRLGAQVNVPRTAAEQYRASVKVANGQAARGDLVFFRTRGSGVSHVGIYLGGGRFLHAPRTGKTVTTTELSGYWKERLIGFGRIPGAFAIPLPA